MPSVNNSSDAVASSDAQSTDNALRNQNAALRGAAAAFARPPVKPKPTLGSTENGALTAAARRWQASSRGSRTDLGSDTGTLSRQTTGGSSRYGSPVRGADAGLLRQRLDQLVIASGTEHLLQLPAGSITNNKSRSPSHIAATLAASRSASVTPNHTGPSTGAQSSRRTSYSLSRGHQSQSPEAVRLSPDESLDTASIPPTASLIGMFEGTNTTQKQSAPVRRAATVVRARDPNIQSPKPIQIASTFVGQPILSPSQPPSRVLDEPRKLIRRQTTKSVSPVRPKPRQGPVAARAPLRNPEPETSLQTPPAIPRNASPVPKLPIRRSWSQDSATPRPKPPPPRRQRPAPTASAMGTTNTGPHAAQIDALANAIVASSLASSRAASPSRQQRQRRPQLPPPQQRSSASSVPISVPLPPARRRGGGGGLKSHSSSSSLFHGHFAPATSNNDESRTPSPVRTGMRQTMRKPSREDKDEERERERLRRGRGKGHLMMKKKHPNKHNEGDRKRWRDEVTERERKRYEAVWASNRGLHTYDVSASAAAPSPKQQQQQQRPPLRSTNSSTSQLSMVPPPQQPAEDMVLNLLVRDVWARSRLGVDVLEEVYDLVDRTGTGMLQKEEFVVGLWLIDQRLKGRKLPQRVSEHVWRSVGRLNGLKVRGKR